eukprot:TRINITY_DN2418_c0_g1_i1.p1 TRINITY_DN2418_c0_g1~~TRINITY_DN2418_c0_g1_i1.p1  ORF type:complete len:275 (+),score=69.42 TRINITY_DN2418_c0_g1_i1:108-932(+)
MMGIRLSGNFTARLQNRPLHRKSLLSANQGGTFVRTMRFTVVACVAVAALALGAIAQDPAEGWLGYAAGTSPSSSSTRITYMEAKWKVGQNPVSGGAFFSPWFGIESSDNLNLIQPVNPWVGDHWEIYNEYFQWSPENNINSDSHTVQPGDILFGSVKFNEGAQTYTVYHSDLNDSWSVSTDIPVQQTYSGDYKNFTIAYVVFEKDAYCSQYPPDNEVTFFDIEIQYDGVTVEPQWKTDIVDDVCENRAHVVDSKTIKFTWNSNAADSKKKVIE